MAARQCAAVPPTGSCRRTAARQSAARCLAWKPRSAAVSPVGSCRRTAARLSAAVRRSGRCRRTAAQQSAEVRPSGSRPCAAADRFSAVRACAAVPPNDRSQRPSEAVRPNEAVRRSVIACWSVTVRLMAAVSPRRARPCPATLGPATLGPAKLARASPCRAGVRRVRRSGAVRPNGRLRTALPRSAAGFSCRASPSVDSRPDRVREDAVGRPDGVVHPGEDRSSDRWPSAATGLA
jgi:hypothetical protein